ncbi:MAG: STAS domain-containing protein [Candidatus Kapaibacteriota bacterium]
MNIEEIQFHQLKPNVIMLKLPPQLLGGNLTSRFTEIIEKIKTQKIEFVLLDLSQVELINSLGLGMIVAAFTSLKKNSISLVLISPTEKVSNLLNITHLNTIFKIYYSTEEFLNTI